MAAPLPLPLLINANALRDYDYDVFDFRLLTSAHNLLKCFLLKLIGRQSVAAARAAALPNQLKCLRTARVAIEQFQIIQSSPAFGINSMSIDSIACAIGVNARSGIFMHSTE